MSTVGLSTLATLKAWLLPAGLVAGTDYDAQIAAIGNGVAGQLERHCNRLFLRTVGDTFECPADCYHVTLPRYPLEAVPTIEQRDSLADGFVAVTFNDLVQDYNLKAGLIKFSGLAGPDGSRLRFTYTGGYWPGPGATALPSRQSGRVALTADAESLAIVFDSAFGAAPVVTLNIELPSGGTIITAVPSIVTAAGFTAIFGFPIPAAGYYLSWTAVSLAAAADDSELPIGATAVPEDLLLAWRLQCEQVWTKRDKLGLNIGEKQDNVFQGALSRIGLLDGVVDMLHPYRRYSLT
jgi:hypothetical protein